jgi:hypothetical protein
LRQAREKADLSSVGFEAKKNTALGPRAEDLIVFVKPDVKSNYDNRDMKDLWGPAPEHRKGWVCVGLSKKPRDGIAKVAPQDVRHQLLSGW